MPIHEYSCQACGHQFETLVRAFDIPSCASCGSTALDKKLSVFATKGEEQAQSCGTCGNPAGPGACRFS